MIFSLFNRIYMCRVLYERKRDFFMFLWFKFTREERRAMRKKIEMTQEIFDSIMKKREIIGEEAEDLSLQLMIKYPDFLEVNARRICEEYGIDFDMELPEEPSEETQRSYEEFLRRVEEKEREEKKKNRWKIKKKPKQYVL